MSFTWSIQYSCGSQSPLQASNVDLDSLSIHNRETFTWDQGWQNEQNSGGYDYTLRKVGHLRKSTIDIIKEKLPSLEGVLDWRRTWFSAHNLETPFGFR